MVMNFGFYKIKPYICTPGYKIMRHRQGGNEKAIHEMNVVIMKEYSF
jgi:hypothetical protein